MEFDDHVCITTLPGDRRLAESKKKFADLITTNRRWEAKDSGYYFGSPVQTYTPSVPPPKGGIWRSLFKVTRGNVNDEGLNRRSSNYPGPSSPAPSTTDSSYHTADSPVESMPPSPVVESPTPRSATSSITVPRIKTNRLGVSDPPQSSGESMGSSLHSMFHTRYGDYSAPQTPDLPNTRSPHSSYTSHSEVYLESCTEENEGLFSKPLEGDAPILSLL